MILTDTGPLVALIDRGEQSHEKCKKSLEDLNGPMIITPPVFTEAIYLLGSVSGWHAQAPLWKMLSRKAVKMEPFDRPMWFRARDLMKKYSDQPMDLADATLVALAESRVLKRIFTLDDDFHRYRKESGESFEVIP